MLWPLQISSELDLQAKAEGEGSEGAPVLVWNENYFTSLATATTA